MCFDLTHSPSPSVPPISTLCILPSLHTQLRGCYFPMESNVCYSANWDWRLPWFVISLPGVTSLKKTPTPPLPAAAKCQQRISQWSGFMSASFNVCWLSFPRSWNTGTVTESYVHQPYCVWKALLLGALNHLWNFCVLVYPFFGKDPWAWVGRV